jgi:hypothetical protein
MRRTLVEQRTLMHLQQRRRRRRKLLLVAAAVGVAFSSLAMVCGKQTLKLSEQVTICDFSSITNLKG